MNENKKIIIQHTIHIDDLRCIICLEFVHPPFYQCNGGLHFVCPCCSSKLKSDSCPSCRENTLFKNILLERDLCQYLPECPHSLCTNTLFEWDLINHVEACVYAASKCYLMLKPEDFKNHLTMECEGLKWAEKNNQETKGSVQLLSHLRWNTNGFKVINLHKLASDFVVFLNEAMFLVKRSEENWTIVVLSANSMRIDAYFKYPSNKVFERQAILTMNSFRTCKEFPEPQDMVAIPHNVRKIEFMQSVFDPEDEDSTSYVSEDEFFGGLVT